MTGELKMTATGIHRAGAVATLAIAAGCASEKPGAALQSETARAKTDSSWSATFVAPAESYAATGRNRYFVLEPGYQLVLEGKEDGKAVVLTITVLNDTKEVAGVLTRVVEERETADGRPAETSRNYFAVGTTSHNVYYFGEDVDVFKGGRVSHEGSWLAGVDGAKPGILMPGDAKLGARYYQEQAPTAMDRAEHVSDSETIATPAGRFDSCLKVKETTPLEAGTEYKSYAPNIGLIQEGELKLVKYGSVRK